MPLIELLASVFGHQIDVLINVNFTWHEEVHESRQFAERILHWRTSDEEPTGCSEVHQLGIQLRLAILQSMCFVYNDVFPLKFTEEIIVLQMSKFSVHFQYIISKKMFKI